MTKQELQKLNIVMAEKVMGWELTNYEDGRRATTQAHYDDAMTNDGWTWTGEEEAWQWQPTTNGAHTLAVLKKLAERDAWPTLICLTHTEPKGSYVWHNDDYEECIAPTLEVAICQRADEVFGRAS